MRNRLLLVLMALLPMVANAYDIAVENDYGVTIYYNYINNGAELEVTRYNTNYNVRSYSGSVVIPEEVTYTGITRKVTSIGEEAFYKCISLISIKIPHSVTSIKQGAFYGCTALTSVTIPGNMESTGYFTFKDCI